MRGKQKAFVLKKYWNFTLEFLERKIEEKNRDRRGGCRKTFNPNDMEGFKTSERSKISTDRSGESVAYKENNQNIGS